jgi:hypothetical protein
MVSRLRAAIMAVCFLCAGVVLPDLDAVLFHGVRSQDESRPHVESTGAETCHAEKCVLGAGLPQGQKSSDLPSDFTRFDDPAVLLQPFSASISDRTPSGASDSRAPPAAPVS